MIKETKNGNKELINVSKDVTLYTEISPSTRIKMQLVDKDLFICGTFEVKDINSTYDIMIDLTDYLVSNDKSIFKIKDSKKQIVSFKNINKDVALVKFYGVKDKESEIIVDKVELLYYLSNTGILLMH